MDGKHRNLLRVNTVQLVNNLELKDVLDFLLEKGSITQYQYEDLIPELKSQRRDKNRELLGVLGRRGPKVFDDFCDALIYTGQLSLAELLCPEKVAPVPEKRGSSDSSGNPVAIPMDEENTFIAVEVKETSPAFFRNLRDKSEVYRMTTPRGRVLLINNEDFRKAREKNVRLADREGTTYDAMNVTALFQAMSFEVDAHRNLESEKMLETIKGEVQNPDHDRFGMFVLIVLSHGEQDAVYGTDGLLLKIIDIKRQLGSYNFKSMVGKPKLILLQACQGTSHDRGLTQSDGTDSSDAVSSATASSVPVFADMLVAYPTVEGHVSYRNTLLGSWFIRAIVNIFMACAHDTSVSDMLMKVRGYLSTKSTSTGGKQGTYEQNYLHKKLFLFPGLDSETMSQN